MKTIRSNLTVSTTSLIHQRAWKSGALDSGSVLALGNGRLLAYAHGPNLFQIQGPPYTSPLAAELNLADAPGLTCVSSRETGAGIWHHEMSLNGSPIGKFVDFVDAEMPILVRMASLRQTVELVLDMPHSVPFVAPRMSGVKSSVLGMIPPGTPVYDKLYVSPHTTAVQFMALGQAEVIGDAVEGRRRRVLCRPGESLLAVVGGPEYPQCIEYGERLATTSAERLLERTRTWWRSFTAGRPALRFNRGVPLKQELLEAIDDTAVIIRTQQSNEGAVVAGYPFVMGYVRDQYGVSRALLAIGHLPEARRILEFYWGIFQRYGHLHNAQCIGLDGVFHRHENDNVEITGFLLIQAFDYLSASRDEAFVATIEPMLNWALQAQISQVVDGMLPFNGDETYIAGGVLPRSILLDGSSESTLLFIEGGSRFLRWKRRRGKPSPSCEVVLENIRSRYRDNFWSQGRLWANNPGRAEHVAAPRFRHGVCLGDRGSGCHFFGWTERGEDGRYFCPRCLVRQTQNPRKPERFFLPSIAMTSLLIGSELIAAEDNRIMLDAIICQFERTGLLTSSLSGQLPGYESGVLLNALVSMTHPASEALYRLCIALRDDTGAWAEYYAGRTPAGTRYRPWESALNIVGALAFAQST